MTNRKHRLRTIGAMATLISGVWIYYAVQLEDIRLAIVAAIFFGANLTMWLLSEIGY